MVTSAKPNGHRATHDAERGIETVAVWAGEKESKVDGSAIFPIFQAATFQYGGEKNYNNVRYLRCNNCPNQVVLAKKLAALEGTEAAMVTSSGMAAISTALLSFLGPGDHLLTAKSLYGGTYDFTKNDLVGLGVALTRVDVNNPTSWEDVVTSRTKVFYVEVMSNPLVQLGDLEAVVAFAKKHSLLTMIDCTFATPVLFRAVKDWGFDISLHSATKYLNGHSDIVAGVFAGSTELVEKIRTKQNHLGGSLDPNSCFLLQRGLKTLALRVNQQCKNALALCEFLETRREVKAVNYPALKSSPYFKRVQRLLGGRAGGLFSFELVGGVAAADIFLESLEFALSAPSLGGVETLVTRPATTSHSGLTAEELQDAGISEGLIRVAVGIETTKDLIHDFAQALDKASQ